MPVVFVEVGGVARSGHRYNDLTGVAYEYPTGRYDNWVGTGDRFVYQRPGVGYVGCGIVGMKRPSPRAGRTICDVLQVQMFDEPVSLRDPSGQYFEQDPTYWKDKVYWGRGVRRLTDSRLDAILDSADAVPEGTGSERRRYATSADAAAVEAYSVGVASKIARGRFGGPVTEMPRNNPGFDLRVGNAGNPVRFVEVKGTRTLAPAFFMSEGERQFSIRNADLYTLIVVSGIDLVAGSHAMESIVDGAVHGDGFELAPTQWRGEVQPTQISA